MANTCQLSAMYFWNLAELWLLVSISTSWCKDQKLQKTFLIENCLGWLDTGEIVKWFVCVQN